MKRRFLLFAPALALAAHGAPAHSQDRYPSRAVKLVVPFSAGSTADMVARVLAERLSGRLKQPFVVDNRAGAGGSVGTGVVAKSPPDGYTLLLTTSSPLTINPVLQKNVPYNVEKDLLPIGMIAAVPVVLVSNPAMPAANLSELIAHLKKNPGRYSYASSGPGSYANITMEMFKQVLGLEITHVPYKGPAQAETDVVAGQVALMFDGIATANPLIQASRLKAYGVTSARRSAFAADIPTFTEMKAHPELRDFVVTSWVSLSAPAGTAPEIVRTLNREINEALKSPDFRKQLESRSYIVYEPNSPQQIPPLIASEKARWAKVIADGNIQPE